MEETKNTLELTHLCFASSFNTQYLINHPIDKISVLSKIQYQANVLSINQIASSIDIVEDRYE